MMLFADDATEHARHVARLAANATDAAIRKTQVRDCCDRVQVAVANGNRDLVEQYLNELSALTGRPRHARKAS